jgi:hypothetical protein
VKLCRVNVRIVGDDGGEGTLVTSRFRRLGGPAAMRRCGEAAVTTGDKRAVGGIEGGKVEVGK